MYNCIMNNEYIILIINYTRQIMIKLFIKSWNLKMKLKKKKKKNEIDQTQIIATNNNE